MLKFQLEVEEVAEGELLLTDLFLVEDLVLKTKKSVEALLETDFSHNNALYNLAHRSPCKTEDSLDLRF